MDMGKLEDLLIATIVVAAEEDEENDRK